VPLSWKGSGRISATLATYLNSAISLSPCPLAVKLASALIGRLFSNSAKATEYEPNRKFGKNITCGSLTNEQHNTYGPIEGGIKFTIVYDMKVGGFLKLFSPLLVCPIRKELKKALSNLKGILEAQA